MKRETKENIKGWVKFGVYLVIVLGILCAINISFMKNDEVLNGKPHTLTYKVYYTENNIVTKTTSGVYSYNLSSHRGSNCLQVLKGNCSKWVPIMKHVGVLGIVNHSTQTLSVKNVQTN